MTETLRIQLASAVAASRPKLLWRIYAAVAVIAVALPALLVRLPPLLDYPNHYTRVWLLEGGIRHGVLSHMYAVDWHGVWTNIGIDILSQAIGGLIPASTLAPLLLAAAVVLPPLGAILLHRRLFGAFRWWQIGIPIAAFPTTLLAGFVNYQIGLGLALLAAGADPWLQRRVSPIQLLIARVAFALGLMVVHIYALGFYGVLLGGLALGPNLTALFKAAELRRTALRLTAIAGAVAVPVVAYLLTLTKLHSAKAMAPIWGPTTFQYKLDMLTCAFGTYDLTIDRLFLGAVAGLALISLATRTLKAHQGLLVGALGLVVVALVAPTWAADTGWVDTRIPIMALLIVLAALNPSLGKDDRGGMFLGALLMVLVAGRAAWIGDIWEQSQGDVRSIDRALSHVPAGAAVLPLDHRPSIRGKWEALRDHPGRYFHFGASFYHDYTLAVMERDAFSPLVFASPGKQPLRVLPPWDAIAAPNGGRSPTLEALTHPSHYWDEQAPYTRLWRRFDYALLLDADLLEDVNKEPLPQGMTLIDDEGFARLYKISPISQDPPSR